MDTHATFLPEALFYLKTPYFPLHENLPHDVSEQALCSVPVN